MDKHFIELKTHTLSHHSKITTEKSNQAKITLDSSALLAITDLRHHDAVTIAPTQHIQDAHNLMIARGIRLLFVMENTRFIGLITAYDLLGEKPIALHKRHTEISVSEIMQEKSSLRVIEFEDLKDASVGDLMATMKKIGKHHALVVKNTNTDNEEVVGLASASHITNITGQIFKTRLM